jgi:UDP-N-acetylmuramate dehydrogenase
MEVKENILMKDYTTLRLGGPARFFVTAFSKSDILEATHFAKSNNLPIVPLGGGSNLVVRDVLPEMLVLKMENKDLEIISENSEEVLIRVSAGFILDEFVEFTVKNRWSGIEALSSIPGTSGATPIQNVGAYGAEVGSVIQSVRIFDKEIGEFKDIEGVDCRFSYRDSIFKKELKGKCIIESIVFELKKTDPIIPSYPKVLEILTEMKKENEYDSPNMLIRKAIQKIRSEKLPNPKVVGNVGSFFQNPIVSIEQTRQILEEFPDMPHFVFSDKFKIPAGWLIEKSGLKGFSRKGVSVYQKNALVLVNNSAISTDEVFELAEVIQKTVNNKFGLWFEIEPEIL